MKFDGLALAVDTPQRMTILRPDKGIPLQDADGNEAWVELLSPDGETAQAHERRMIDARLARPGRTVRSVEEIQADAVARLAAVTTGWRLVAFTGEPVDLPFNEASARELYASGPMFWLREQVEAFLTNRANFMPASSKS